MPASRLSQSDDLSIPTPPPHARDVTHLCVPDSVPLWQMVLHRWLYRLQLGFLTIVASGVVVLFIAAARL